MKQLRILTGLHAGVQLNLTSARYLIGAHDQADIQITDWQTDPLTLESTGPDDMFSIAMQPSNSSAPQDGNALVFADLMPRRFQDIVLCIGPAGAAWPADVDLISRLLQPVAQAARVTHRSAWAIGGAVLALLATAGFGTAVAHLSQSGGTHVAAEPLKAQVERAVQDLAFGGLTVRQDGDGVVVQGLLNGPTEVAALRKQLEVFAHGRIVHAYAAATDVAQSIADALAQPGLTVAHQGQGVFVVSGQAQEIEHVRDSAKRIAVDLAPQVRRIDVAAVNVAPAAHTPVSAMLSADGLQYVQTRDGVKHLSITSTLSADAAQPRDGEAPVAAADGAPR